MGPVMIFPAIVLGMAAIRILRTIAGGTLPGQRMSSALSLGCKCEQDNQPRCAAQAGPISPTEEVIAEAKIDCTSNLDWSGQPGHIHQAGDASSVCAHEVVLSCLDAARGEQGGGRVKAVCSSHQARGQWDCSTPAAWGHWLPQKRTRLGGQ